MSSDYDASEFIDGDLAAQAPGRSAAGGPVQRAPTREEVDSQVTQAQQKLAELKRAQEQLERERAALEETRRRQTEFQTGRQEMVQNLTRATGLLEEAEFNSRRDAEQMSKLLLDLRDALSKVQAIHEETWTKNNFNVELTRALTTLENGRMEWNAARLKFPVLSSPVAQVNAAEPEPGAAPHTVLGVRSFGELCRVGFALTWPLAAVALMALAVLVAVLLRR